MASSELRLRILTGLLIGIVVIGAILGGSISSYILVAIICIWSSVEFFLMQSGDQRKFRWEYTLCMLPLVVFMLRLFLSDDINKSLDYIWAEVIATMFVSVVMFFLVNMRNGFENLAARISQFGLAIILFGVPGIFALSISYISPLSLLYVFVLLWSNDVFAYFGGRAFGKHKLAPAISPKKTWEGFAFGLVATIVFAWAVGYFYLFSIDFRPAIVTGVLVVIFGTTGDLLQSVFKRSAGVKDSGNILPGHGGIWDRFDSFLGSIPWVGAYYLLFE